jgi:ACS family tartrate transporter-like MFS transporter
MTLAERVLDRPEYQPFDATVEPRTMRRVSLRLLPLLFVCYVAAYLDRANVSFAALQMNRELHFSAAVYGFGASVFYVGYAVLEVPSNLVLARIGARRWIARIMITWGVVAAAMMFVRTPLSFYVLRFLLGVAEAGFFPGVVYYLSEWFPANRRARAVSRFMLGIPIAGIVSGLVSGPLLGLEGRWSLAGWQWLFVIEALPSVVLGFVVLAMLTDRPADARWLADDEQRVQRVRRDAGDVGRHRDERGVGWGARSGGFAAAGDRERGERAQEVGGSWQRHVAGEKEREERRGSGGQTPDCGERS